MSDEEEAEIIRTIFRPSYSHAENVLLRLREYEKFMSTKDAIEKIHDEVVPDC